MKCTWGCMLLFIHEFSSGWHADDRWLGRPMAPCHLWRKRLCAQPCAKWHRPSATPTNKALSTVTSSLRMCCCKTTATLPCVTLALARTSSAASMRAPWCYQQQARQPTVPLKQVTFRNPSIVCACRSQKGSQTSICAQSQFACCVYGVKFVFVLCALMKHAYEFCLGVTVHEAIQCGEWAECLC